MERSEREDGGRDRDRDRDEVTSGGFGRVEVDTDGVVRGRKSEPSPHRGVLVRSDGGDQEEEVVHSPEVVRMRGGGGDVMEYLRTVAEVCLHEKPEIG